MKGKVKSFDHLKGYGFLEVSETGFLDSEDSEALGPIFVHYTAIQGDGFKDLKEGETVEFDLVEGPKGPQASNVFRKRKL